MHIHVYVQVYAYMHVYVFTYTQRVRMWPTGVTGEGLQGAYSGVWVYRVRVSRGLWGASGGPTGLLGAYRSES
jgi:hypothetical protein